MRNTKRNRVRCALLGLLIVALVVLLAACGGSSETTTTTAAPTTTGAPPTTSGASTTGGASATSVALTGDEATIAGNFVKFFDGTQPVADKIGLLENGEQYTKELETQAASSLGRMASVEVSAVTITSPEAADVKYTILVGGTPALPDQTGQAVLQDGVWKVSAQTFVALLTLQGMAPPAP